MLPTPATAPAQRPNSTRPGLRAAPWLAGLLLAGAAPGLPGLAQPMPEPPAIGAPPAAATLPGGPPSANPSRDAPVVFTADEVEYNDATGVVSARGRVEAWQGERFVRADSFTHDRNTGVSVLRGNVQLIEADGQVLYAEEAELSGGFRDGVLREIQARLPQNARMAARGARRTGGEVTDLAQVVYSSCNLCPEDPTRPPLWQVRARLATQDTRSQRIFYRDARLEVAGVPVLYTPFMSHPDPSAPRASGFLTPEVGFTRFLGPFVRIPYFWAIDDHQDLTATITQGSRVLPSLGLTYRRRFNSGELDIDGSVAYLPRSTLDRLGLFGQSEDERIGGHIAARGRFHVDENWRVGFDLNRASSEAYLRVYRLEVRRVLASQAFAEGFWGTEHYARLDARAYQGLRGTDRNSEIPIVAPFAIYEYAPRMPVLGGFLTMDAGLLGLTRSNGAASQRLTARAAWERPIRGALGDIWTIRTQADMRGFWLQGQDRAPNFLPRAGGTEGDANLRVALDWRMPLVRPVGIWGQQLLEPRVQIVTGPGTGRQRLTPNEDSIDFDFTDANLFALDRFTGRDRFEGGTRVDAAIRGTWLFPNGGRVEGLVGRSYRFSEEALFPPGTGLDRRWSDWVGRASFAPVPWFEIMGRTRWDGRGRHRASDAVAAAAVGDVGPFSNVVLTASYLHTQPVPFLVNDPGRSEVGLGIGGEWRDGRGGVWRANATLRYDLRRERPAAIVGAAGYEDECFIFEARFERSIGFDPLTDNALRGGTTLLFRIAFKTVGDLSLRAL